MNLISKEKIMKKKLILLLLTALALLLVAACQNNDTTNGDDTTLVTHDREGNAVSLPDSISTVISLGPSISEVLVELGFGDMIIAMDMNSFDVAGVDAGLAVLDMFTPDAEQIIALEPDVIFVTQMGLHADDGPLGLVADTGISVLYIPSSDSIAGIKEDIRFIAAVMGNVDGGAAIIAQMAEEIETVRAIGQGITEVRTVYFEVGTPPWLTSFGAGTFLHEMLEIIGAVNIVGDQHGWVPLSEEVVLDANPDVILTNVVFVDDPIEDIVTRPGWDMLDAVQNGELFFIDANASSRPNHNIVQALWEMARAIYPDAF